MSDSLMRSVRVQLTTTMDSVLRTAVFEVMRILESALYNHKMEMVQKGEEIAQLKLKLQAADLKLKDYEMSSRTGAETTETQSKPEVAPEQPVTVPEIDVEVPDDWCAPLGCDMSNKQEEGCPSVRLRQFSIRLSPVPLVKHEEDSNVTDVQKSLVGRRSKRISAMNEKPNPSQDECKPAVNQAARHRKLSGDLNRLLQGLSKDYCDLSGLDRLRKRRTSEETFTDNDKKEEKGKEDSSKHQEKNPKNSKYICETCCKVLNTKKSLHAHVRSQRKCKGCLKVFCFQNDVKLHKRVCADYKKSMKERRRLQGKKTPGQNKAEGIGKKEITQSSADKNNLSTRKFSCKKCIYKTNSRKKFRRHKMCHSEKMQTSPVCLEILDEKKESDVHEKKHKSLMEVSNQNGDLGWTEPLEDVDEDGGLRQGEKMQE